MITLEGPKGYSHLSFVSRTASLLAAMGGLSSRPTRIRFRSCVKGSAD